MQLTVFGIWHLFGSRQILGFLASISLLAGYGLAYFGSNDGGLNILYTTIVIITPLGLGLLYVLALSLVAIAAEKLKSRQGSANKVVDIPMILPSAVITPIMVAITSGLRYIFDDGYQLEWRKFLINTIFVAIAFEVVLRFILIVLVPRALDGLSDAKFLRSTGLKRSAVQDQQADAPKIEPFMINIGGHTFMRKDVLMLEAQSNYVNIMTPDQNILVRGPLSAILKKLDGLEGTQIHRSRWVTLHACKMLQKKGANLFLHLTNGEVVKVVKARHDAVQDVFEKRKAN